MSCIVCATATTLPFRVEAGYAIVACGGCGLRYIDPQPDAKTVEALYTEGYFHSGDDLARGYTRYAEEAGNWRATFRDRLAYLPAGQRVLDVGAAAGFFVEVARKAGREAEGVEPSDWAATYARETLGVPVKTGMLESAGYPDASFDLVTFWEVIEHLPDPRPFLAEVARLVPPGGHLALSTPDAGSLAARLSGRRWLGWQKVPEHLYFFDQPSLEKLLAGAGFTVTSARYVSLTVTVGFAMDRLSSLLGWKWLAKVPRGLADLPLRVNPYYDLMLVARRDG